MTVNYIGTPAKFLHGFQYTTRIEDSAAVVVVILYAVFVHSLHPILEIIIIIDEIYLHTCGLDRSYFYNKGVVSIIDNQVHTGEANHFVQLVPALVNVSPLGIKVLISRPFSCIACGRFLPILAISDSET